MKNYRYDKNNIIEKSTSFVIKKCKLKEEAKLICGKLNSGCGFDGDTPKFFVYVKDQV